MSGTINETENVDQDQNVRMCTLILIYAPRKSVLLPHVLGKGFNRYV